MNFGVPLVESSRFMASQFKWGRIVGRTNLGVLKIALKDMPKTMIVVSDTTRTELTFQWTGVRMPHPRYSANIPPYGEWRCISEDAKLRQLKIHIEALAYQPLFPAAGQPRIA